MIPGPDDPVQVIFTGCLFILPGQFELTLLFSGIAV